MEDCAAIERAAGKDPRSAKLVTILCGFTYEQCSQDAALEAIALNNAALAKNDDVEHRHDCGLDLGANLSVRGGPLFAPPGGDQAAEDHGWNGVVAEINKTKPH